MDITKTNKKKSDVVDMVIAVCEYAITYYYKSQDIYGTIFLLDWNEREWACVK